MAKNQNTVEKRRREMEKKRKADEKRERRRQKKDQAINSSKHESHSGSNRLPEEEKRP